MRSVLCLRIPIALLIGTRSAFGKTMSSVSISAAGTAASIVTTEAKSAGALMPVIAVRKSQVAYPTGRRDFAVMQPFPSAVTTEESDPFLMCDLFGPTRSEGEEVDPDSYPVAWHPHRGMDIATYLIEGRGRHADSLGNRETFESPGLQWCSVGSGIEHAEAGGTPAGVNTTGFQIWINVPSARKMDEPRYGTVQPQELPTLAYPGGVTARLVSGEERGQTGPFRTVQPLLMLDVSLPAGATWEAPVAPHLDNVMAFVYRGAADVNGAATSQHGIALLDSRGRSGARGVRVSTAAGGAGASVMIFAGKRLNQPVAWRGPFVMTTDAELRDTIREYQSGDFPPVRVPWDYKRLGAFPPDHPARKVA